VYTRAQPPGLAGVLLGPPATTGPIDDAARRVAVYGSYELAVAKAVVASYLVGVIKGKIPPYCSYNRTDGKCTPTVQDVVAFLVKATQDPDALINKIIPGLVHVDWMRLQSIMDTLEELVLQGQISPSLLWPTDPELTSPEVRQSLMDEIFQFFQLDKSTAERSLSNLFGIDLSDLKTYLLYGLLIYAAVVLGPPLISTFGSRSRSS
jgi:hypothetical protein